MTPENGKVIHGEMSRAADDSNVVILCGRLVNRYEKRNVIMITVSVLEMVRGKKQINYPKIYFFKEDNTAVNDFMVGDEVYVNAHISAPTKRRRSGEAYISQALIGDAIRMRQSLCPEVLAGEDVPGRLMEPQMNAIYLRGPLQETVRHGENVIGLKILVEDHGHKGVVELTTVRQEALLMKPGTMVTAYGKITTKVRIIPGERTKHYQNMILLSVREEKEEKGKGERDEKADE